MNVDKNKLSAKIDLIEQFVSRPAVVNTENGIAILSSIPQDRILLGSSSDQVL